MPTDDPAAVLEDPYEVIPNIVFDEALHVMRGLVVSCLEPDVPFAAELCAKMVRCHHAEGAFTTALALAELFAQRTGLAQAADGVPPGQLAMLSVAVPGSPPLFDPSDQYAARREAAMAFVQAYLNGQQTAMYAEIQAVPVQAQLRLMHGLCELVIATYQGQRS